MNTPEQPRTTIYKRTGEGEEMRERALGYVGADGIIYKLRWDEGHPIGRVDAQGTIYRRTAYDERELGTYTPDGRVRSHGLFQGGDLGWIESNGLVVQAGLILGEEDVGRVEGPNPYAAGAALLLLFLPDDAEEDRQARKSGG
jgi:hypothetical protein